MSGSAGLVAVEDLWVSYRSLLRIERVLRGVDMQAPPGAVTALVGRNGVGKTTLFRALLGFHSPDRGQISISGRAPDRDRATTGLGYLPETLHFPSGWTTRDVLARGVDLSVAAPDRPQALLAGVRRAGLDKSDLSRQANRCSKGIQRRLALAFALIGDPRVVFLDEPFSGLDPPSRISLRAEIKRTVKSGATVLLASHDLSEVGRLADQVFKLESGTVTRLSRSADDNSVSPISDLEQSFGEERA